LWGDAAGPRPDRQDPYLRLHHVAIYVRDQDRSLRFFRDRLGFTLVSDHRFAGGGRWVAVAPPDGTAILALVTPAPGSAGYDLIGRSRDVTLVTEDVEAKYGAWSKRGVRFHHPPRTPTWGGTFTSFEDEDGNVFVLIGFDEVSRQLETQRRAAAERLESERRAAQELEIAKQVQARLFPQAHPPLRTLEYAGACLQARQVGGDYYDFLDFGRGRLGLVIADISGKGMPAALLMANLQANLRSQSALALEQPQRLLQSVNRLFYENTADYSYATLFFADYNDELRAARYVNCGHLAAIVLRRNGPEERLDATGTVLGMFPDWESPMRDVQLRPGDTLAVFTDGITESCSREGEEFGEGRLIDTLRRNEKMHAQELLQQVLKEVQRFRSDEPHDDITLIVAKCRAD
jgi:serine phosphatase RsbU (regulator of sigma subunit)/predicted enzyme related to lactoylglutathione lyase